MRTIKIVKDTGIEMHSRYDDVFMGKQFKELTRSDNIVSNFIGKLTKARFMTRHIEPEQRNWYDGWKIENEDNQWTISLPNSSKKEKSITIKGKYTRKHIAWLVDALACALMELTKKAYGRN